MTCDTWKSDPFLNYRTSTCQSASVWKAGAHIVSTVRRWIDSCMCSWKLQLTGVVWLQLPGMIFFSFAIRGLGTLSEADRNAVHAPCDMPCSSFGSFGPSTSWATSSKVSEEKMRQSQVDPEITHRLTGRYPLILFFQWFRGLLVNISNQMALHGFAGYCLRHIDSKEHQENN